MRFSLFKSKTDTQPELVERTFPQLCSRVRRPGIRAEKDGRLFSPAVIEGNRKNGNVRELSAIVLDLDHDVPPFEEVCRRANLLGCAYVIHSTYSHLQETENNPNAERRYRFLFPLESPVTAADYKALRRAVIKLTGLPADPAASALAQMYYTPVKSSADAPYEYHIKEGDFLDRATLDLTEPEPLEKKMPATTFAPTDGLALSIDERLRKAFAAKNGAKTFRLFEGDTSAFGGDKSRADRSFASRCIFFAGNPVTLEEMLRRSRLARPKWDEVHYEDGRTYLQGLIDKAFEEHNGEFYRGNGHQPTQGASSIVSPSLTGSSNPEIPPNLPRFRFTSVTDLIAEPAEKVDYVVADTLACGGFSILAAKPKVGKTTTVQALAFCVARGETFLGRTVKRRGRVLYLCLEEKRAEVQRRFRRMRADGADILIHSGKTPANSLTALDLEIEEYSPALTIIDPLSRFIRVSDFNDYGTMARGLEPLIDLARNSACQTHILCVHHNSKGGDLRENGDALLGSSALFASVDTLLTMRKRERVRTIESIQRYGVDLPETIVRLDPETGFIEAAGDMQAFTLHERKQAIVKAMGHEEITEVAIKELVAGSNKGLTSKAIRALFDEGTLLRSGGGKKGDPFLYRLAGTNSLTRDVDQERYAPAFTEEWRQKAWEEGGAQ